MTRLEGEPHDGLGEGETFPHEHEAGPTTPLEKALENYQRKNPSYREQLQQDFDKTAVVLEFLADHPEYSGEVTLDARHDLGRRAARIFERTGYSEYVKLLEEHSKEGTDELEKRWYDKVPFIRTRRLVKAESSREKEAADFVAELAKKTAEANEILGIDTLDRERVRAHNNLVALYQDRLSQLAEEIDAFDRAPQDQVAAKEADEAFGTAMAQIGQQAVDMMGKYHLLSKDTGFIGATSDQRRETLRNILGSESIGIESPNFDDVDVSDLVAIKTAIVDYFDNKLTEALIERTDAPFSDVHDVERLTQELLAKNRLRPAA